MRQPATAWWKSEAAWTALSAVRLPLRDSGIGQRQQRDALLFVGIRARHQPDARFGFAGVVRQVWGIGWNVQKITRVQPYVLAKTFAALTRVLLHRPVRIGVRPSFVVSRRCRHMVRRAWCAACRRPFNPGGFDQVATPHDPDPHPRAPRCARCPAGGARRTQRPSRARRRMAGR